MTFFLLLQDLVRRQLDQDDKMDSSTDNLHKPSDLVASLERPGPPGPPGNGGNIANYVPNQRLEWKRYKQYTRNDIMAAIEEVKKGNST